MNGIGGSGKWFLRLSVLASSKCLSNLHCKSGRSRLDCKDQVVNNEIYDLCTSYSRESMTGVVVDW